MDEVKLDILKQRVSVIMHLATKILYIFPINRKKIIFEAYTGTQYSCSPKAICEHLESQKKGYEMLWVYRDKPLDCPYKQIKRNSLSYYYHIFTAGALIINSGHNRLVKLRRKQIFINTWHGGGAYKKLVHPNYREHFRKNDFYLSSCRKASELVIRQGQVFDGEILETGLPRNDMLINQDKAKISRIKESLGLGDRKCVLYAPTFREDRNKVDFALDYDRLLSNLGKRFGGQWVVLHRSHYHMKGENDGSAKENVIDVTKYPDMQELLLVADVLITDYSSSIWDYSFTSRPIFLYAPDLDDYNIERSFFVDIHQWPFALACTEAISARTQRRSGKEFSISSRKSVWSSYKSIYSVSTFTNLHKKIVSSQICFRRRQIFKNPQRIAIFALN